MKTRRRALVILAFLGITTAAGCDGEVGTTSGQSGGGGATGGGGSGGATGGGGSGGSGPMCPNVFPESVGLSSESGNDPDPEITVTAVAPDSLTMVSAQSGEEWTLEWAGADLTPHFAPGDSVTLESFPGGDSWSWTTVTGPTMYAAVWSAVFLGCCSGAPEPAPYGGPTFSKQSECYDPYECDHPAGFTCYEESFSIVASSGADQVVVTSFDTQPVGAYQVHNAGTVSRQTTLEGEHHVRVTVLGPVTP